MIDIGIFIGCLILAVGIHELGHMVAALLCGVKVEAFAIGFGKPILHKKIWGIDFRLCPLPFGGYTKLAGEFKKHVPNGFLAQRYSKKAIILVAGVAMNILLAFICYWINYKSIPLGIWIDWQLLKSLWTKDMAILAEIIYIYQPNPILIQLSIINFFCGIFNLIPFPALDGSILWLVLLENKVKNFELFLKRACGWGFAVLMVLQLILVWYIYH